MTSRKTTDQSAMTASESTPPRPARRGPLASPAWAPVEGRVIDNAVSGERIVIRKSGAQTGGRVLAFDLFLPPGGHVPAGHVHPVQEERFTVVAGSDAVPPRPPHDSGESGRNGADSPWHAALVR